jgi:hypothetical protein
MVITSSNQTITQLVQEQLMGPGASAFNVIVNGASADEVSVLSVGAFECEECNIDLTAGLAMSTGNVFNMVGPNNVGSQTTEGLVSFGSFDPDMYELVIANGGDELNDMTIIEFDFIPFGDSIAFDFIWASEEYNSFVSSSYNDVFGLFVSGPGINGTFENNAINLGVIPGTAIPVSVNTINNGNNLTGPCMACEYFNQPYSDESLWNLTYSNDPYVTDPRKIQFDGFTDVLSNGIAVQCGQTYHVKIAICDASDNSLDSGVFIRKGTLTSNFAADASLNMSVDGPNDNSVYEDCGEGTLRIHRPAVSDMQSALTCYLEWQGNALQGVDYNTMPDSVVFSAQQEYIDIPFEAFPDDSVEFADTVELVMTIPSVCNGVSATTYFMFYITDVTMPFIVQGWSENRCEGAVVLEPFVSGGFGNYTYEWNTGSAENQLEVYLSDTVVYTVIVGDTCGIQDQTAVFAFNVPQVDPLTVWLEDTDGILPLQCGDFLPIYAYPEGGLWPYTFNFTSVTGSWIPSNNNIAQLGVYNAGDLVVRVQDACGLYAFDTLNITVDVPPLELLMPDTIYAMCGQEVFIESSIQGGQPGATYSYSWYLDGGYQSNWSASNVFWSFAENTLVSIYCSNGCFQYDQDTTYIVLTSFDSTLPMSDSLMARCDSLYGCMDVEACNYDSLAEFADGSCYQAAPLAIEGPLVVEGTDPHFYWVADYFPGAELIWTVHDDGAGELISAQDSGCTVLWSAGSATLCVQEILGESCIGDSVCITVDMGWGVGELAPSNAVRVYPNPVSDIAQIALAKPADSAEWFIYAIDGRLVKTGSFKGSLIELNLSDLPIGSYGLKVITQEGIQSDGVLMKR